MIYRKYLTGIIFSFLSIFLVGMIVLTGCTAATSTATVTSTISPAVSSTTGISLAGTNTPSDIYAIAIFLNNKKIAAFTVEDLLKLDQVEITANGSPQNGPTLLSVLKAAGITDFSEVTAFGLSRGRLATAESTLTRDQVDESVIFDMNQRGKCKLCGTNIAQSNWIIDVEKIAVK